MFRITLNRDVAERVSELIAATPYSASANVFWRELARMMRILSKDAANVGEPKYNYKFVKLQNRLAVGNFVAIQYAVREERSFVVVQKISISGKHPYPPEFDEILNPKKL